MQSIKEIQAKQRAKKYEILDGLADTRAAIGALGYVTSRAIVDGEDFSEHAHGLQHLLESQMEALREVEDRVRNKFEQFDAIEHNWTLDALYAAAKIAGVMRNREGEPGLSSEEVRLRADMVVEQHKAGKSPAMIANAMNMDEKAVQWMVDRLRGGEYAADLTKVING